MLIQQKVYCSLKEKASANHLYVLDYKSTRQYKEYFDRAFIFIESDSYVILDIKDACSKKALEYFLQKCVFRSITVILKVKALNALYKKYLALIKYFILDEVVADNYIVQLPADFLSYAYAKIEDNSFMMLNDNSKYDIYDSISISLYAKKRFDLDVINL